MALGTAFRAFFAALFNQEVAQRLQVALDQSAAVGTEKINAPTSTSEAPFSVSKPTSRSDAVTLLATLQREARLVDLIKEDLSAYGDAQIGAAARPCLKQCAATLERLFDLHPIETYADSAMVQIPQGASTMAYQWIGEGSGSTGKLIHHGWQVTRVELPKWTGNDQDAKIVAPVQIQRA